LQQTLNELSQEIQQLNRQLQFLSQNVNRQGNPVRVGINE
jgi:prefoldin subunit 5